MTAMRGSETPTRFVVKDALTGSLMAYQQQPMVAPAMDYADISRRQAELIKKKDRELREIKRELVMKDAEILKLKRALYRAIRGHEQR